MFICKLKNLRATKGISQKELSEQTGIRYPTISEMERNATKSCSLGNLAKLCAFFNCTLNDIYELTDIQSTEKSILNQNDNIALEQISTITNIYKMLDPINQAKLLVHADELKNQSAKNK